MSVNMLHIFKVVIAIAVLSDFQTVSDYFKWVLGEKKNNNLHCTDCYTRLKLLTFCKYIEQIDIPFLKVNICHIDILFLKSLKTLDTVH